jgi:hypothetical protein
MTFREVRVTFSKDKVEVHFTGLWTRALVDGAYKSMMHALPEHLAKERRKLDDERKANKQIIIDEEQEENASNI